jgi:hypothetical protein
MFTGVGAIVIPLGTSVSQAQIRIWKERVAANGGALWDCVPGTGPGGRPVPGGAGAAGGAASVPPPARKRLKTSGSSASGASGPSLACRPTHLIVDGSLSAGTVDRWWRDQLQALTKQGAQCSLQWRELVRATALRVCLRPPPPNLLLAAVAGLWDWECPCRCVLPVRPCFF